uniref:intron-encoded RNA maturase n=1 Tax=Periconia digitata TaxID=1303443 RepID=UPI0023AAF3BE|nr:intron-encoded RNA maturase [Periconia digitata]WCA44860.1 intron-encoded RNA maturase [Periconia digitata]
MWPLNENLSQQTISEEFVLYLLGTICLSCTLLYTAIVKILKINDNSQVTNALCTQVGTSEAIRLLNKKSIHSLSNTNKDLRFKQWLAGLIDGDGCFLLTKKGYASLEITMDIRDERALQAVKNIYGGSIKLRSGVSALRYRLHNKQGLLNLVNDVNGHIRNPVRLIQLNYICVNYNIDLIYPEKLTLHNGWLSGFFDADGTITINSSTWQLSISASQKTSEILTPLVELYGGYVYIDRGGNGSFKWYVTKKEEILNLIEYFKKYPSKSAKNSRLHLVPKIYEFKSMKAHLAPSGSLLAKSWDTLMNKWNNYV